LCFFGYSYKRLKELFDLLGIAWIGTTGNIQLKGLGQMKSDSLTGPLRPLLGSSNLRWIGTSRWSTHPLSAHCGYHGGIVPALISR
jgi:hypothetical protein